MKAGHTPTEIVELLGRYKSTNRLILNINNLFEEQTCQVLVELFTESIASKSWWGRAQP
jgi:hypothetical protein